jgi:anthranilate phosphoribosyltransferase
MTRQPGAAWSPLLAALLAGRNLDAAETRWAMGELLAGRASEAQIAGFAVALRAKGERAEEIAGLAAAMLDHAAPLTVPPGSVLVDTCGTGGDGAHTVNISTMAALVLAGAGLNVAKHGNRAASSSCGSADVLERLGVVIDLPPAAVEACLAEEGPAFCFAPVFHPALRHAAGPRRELGIPTFFNILGPLSNPARPAVQVVGVADERLAPVVADVLAARGTSAWVVRGQDGLDELTTTGPSQVWRCAGGIVTQHTVHPADLGIAPPAPGGLRGGDAAHNALVVEAFLDGERGPVRDAVLLNAAAGLVAARALVEPDAEAAVGDPTAALAPALEGAAAVVDDGRARAAMERWVEVSRRHRP